MSGRNVRGRRWCRLRNPAFRRNIFLTGAACLIFTIFYLNRQQKPGTKSIFHIPGQWENRETLTLQGRQFLLKGKPIQIRSGAIHYFRVPPEYWRDRLRKLKAAGLNTVETYVPWNLHEEVQGKFDFSGPLDLIRFIEIAQEEGLMFIFRPGPYICAEWDLGGLPAWLLADSRMRLRTTYANYTSAVENYFSVLIPKILTHQHGSGGPIIMIQVENEYGSYRQDKNYVPFVADLLRKLGVTEILFTSDGYDQGRMEGGAIPGVFAAVNDRDGIGRALDFLEIFQPQSPLMVAEFWSGWFDHWMEKHSTYPDANFTRTFRQILDRQASFNLYMFHGGTNFGFMNGANILIDPSGTEPANYQPTTTSYDYDAPISEQGRLTDKYFTTAKMLSAIPNSDYVFDRERLKSLEAAGPKSAAYGEFQVKDYLLLTDILKFVTPWTIVSLTTMEEICSHLVTPTVANSVPCVPQNYGFIVYRTQVPSSVADLSLDVQFGDRAHVIIDGRTVATMESFNEGDRIELQFKLSRNRPNDLIFMVENMGRANYVIHPHTHIDRQRKGFFEGSQILLDKKPVESWQVYMLDLKPEFLARLEVEARDNWQPFKVPQSGVHIDPSIMQPALYRIPLEREKIMKKAVKGEWPPDTFINYEGWKKGVAFINGFNLGRYWEEGPQRTLFVPGPRFFGPAAITAPDSTGPNEEMTKSSEPFNLMLFELHQAFKDISLDKSPHFKAKSVENE